MSKDLQGCLLYLGVSFWSFVILSAIFTPGVAVVLFALCIIGYSITRKLKNNKKTRSKKELEKLQKKAEEDFFVKKEEFLRHLSHWKEDGIPQIVTNNPIFKKNNRVFFSSENFFLKSAKNGDFTNGTFMLIDKEVLFLSEKITKTIPYSQTLKLDIGPFELKFISKNSSTPFHFICFSKDAYRDRLEVAEVYAKWYLLNGFGIEDCMPDLEKVFNFPMTILNTLIDAKKE